MFLFGEKFVVIILEDLIRQVFFRGVCFWFDKGLYDFDDEDFFINNKMRIMYGFLLMENFNSEEIG